MNAGRELDHIIASRVMHDKISIPWRILPKPYSTDFETATQLSAYICEGGFVPHLEKVESQWKCSFWKRFDDEVSTFESPLCETPEVSICLAAMSVMGITL